MDSYGEELVQSSTRDIMDGAVVKTVRNIEDLAKQAYNEFIEELIKSSRKEIEDPVKKNKPPLFSTIYRVKQACRADIEETSLKNDVRIFSQLFIATQTKDGDLEKFFSHENGANPPSLACGSKIRSGVKADLFPCLRMTVSTESVVTTTSSGTQNISTTDRNDTTSVEPAGTQVKMTIPEKVDGKVSEGSVLVNLMKPAKKMTFTEYDRTVFLPKVVKELQTVERVDIVFDTYKKDSLNGTTRRKRGVGIRRKVEKQSQVPTNWHSFLRIDENKEELFCFLSEHIKAEINTSNILITTFEDKVLTSSGVNVETVSPYNHEEVDTRVFLHALDMSRSGIQRIMIKTVDTDVIVLAVALFSELNLQELWIDFRSGQTQTYYAIHEICNSLGEESAKAMLFFHAFTGCDQTSFFANCKKKSGWSTWRIFADVTATLAKLNSDPTMQAITDAMPMLERFVVFMYDRTSNCLDVNSCRRDLFVKKGRAMEALPPTFVALLQHSCRAAYQAGHIWAQSLVQQQQLPSPDDWGWTMVGEAYLPHWTDLAEAAIVIRELIKCGCNPEKGCSGRCKCVRAELSCTESCRCNGDCERD